MLLTPSTSAGQTLRKARLEVLVPKGANPSVIELKYNPTEYQLQKSNNFAEIPIPGLESPPIQFVRGTSEKLVGPAGSNVVVLGPVPTSRTSWMAFDLTFAFARWEDVAPFTLTYDISSERLGSVTGSVLVEVHALDWEPR